MNIIIATSFLSFLFSSPSDLANNAEKWEGAHYKRGQAARCADFVGYIVSKSGKTPPTGYQKCTAWLKWGKPVSKVNLKRNDVIIYTKSNGYNHIGIYDGNGMIIHRPTRSKTVRKLKYNYRPILAIRRG